MLFRSLADSDGVEKILVDLVAESNAIAKGNVLATARLAGIQAAKKTGELIPLCHPLPITHCEVTFEIPATRDHIIITASAKIAAQTGVEMEAMTAAVEHACVASTGLPLARMTDGLVTAYLDSRSSLFTASLALDAKGKFIGLKIDTDFNQGAYLTASAGVPSGHADARRTS